MASRDQGNKKTKRSKAKKPQKKRQPAKKKQTSIRTKKQKRQPTKTGSRPVLSISSPRIFAAKILRHMPKVRMETKARGLVKTLLMDVYDQVSKEVESLSQNKEPATVEPAEVQAALKEAMTKELEKHAAEPSSSSSSSETAAA